MMPLAVTDVSINIKIDITVGGYVSIIEAYSFRNKFARLSNTGFRNGRKQIETMISCLDWVMLTVVDPRKRHKETG
ncbi:uncharacterized protein LOC107271459 isoform X2 [Cephus cinctus]|uniref:Uncharacterized protein LOC107271459 isoform X2 n=1 Tax=Cephus cinctus TaxID=211228 RepID=A0AAJ7RP49_CEPCN|nr:uncharacterized protein LOC107271459 isoform X2 [Cephus cinctus]